MKSTQTTHQTVFVYITILLLLLLLFFPSISKAQTTVPFEKRYESQGINGELTMIGNNILSESSDTPYNGDTQNNYLNMVYVDIDGNASTFSSSSAIFSTDPCNRVVYAGLYWGATLAPTVQPNFTRATTPNHILFRIPGGTYQDIIADTNTSVTRDQLETLDLIYYKDVTNLVNTSGDASGEYFVANVNAAEAAGVSAGWSLVIVYEDPTLPRKYISTFDGFSAVTDSPYEQVEFNYSGFVTPPSGPVEGKVGVAAMEGDRLWIGDRMQFRADANASFTDLYDAVNPADNFFNSRITEDGVQITSGNLGSTNTLGWDQKILDLTALNAGNSLIGNGETGATVRVRNDVGGDWIFTFLNTFSINIIEPTLQVITSVEDTDGNLVTLGSPIQLGETVWYNINFQNIGTDNAQNAYILNTLPINVTLDDVSFEFLDEAGNPLPAGLITQTYNPTTRVLRFDIDDSLLVRESDPNNASYNIRYQVTASDQCFDYSDACTNVLINSLESYYDGETSGQNISAQPGLNGINGCGLGNVGSMDLYVDTSSCQFDSELEFCNNTITISGDDGYNLYEWVDENGTPIGNTKEIDIDGPGVYTVTQTKVGCTVTTRVVTVNGLDVTFTPSDALCKDSENGTVSIQVNEASANFTFELFQGSNLLATQGPTATDNHTFSGLDIGTYSVRVTNADGCYDTQTVIIAEPTLLQASNTVLDNIMPCNGNLLSGRIEVSATGGTKFTGGTNEYEYSMDGGAYQASNIFETTQEGSHTITVRDAHGCTTNTVANIDFDEEIEYVMEKEDIVCVGDSDGRITVNVSQNNAGNTLSYSIDGGINFQTSPTFTNLEKGDYEIIIRKEKGVNTCETTEQITVDQLVYLEFEVSGGFSCEGASNTIIATVAEAYQNEVTYYLDGGSGNTTGIFEDVSSGEHNISVTHNSLGCTEEITTYVDNYTPVTFEVDHLFGGSALDFEVIASGGEPEYQYAMLKDVDEGTLPEEDDFVNTNVFTVSGPGIYTFYVRDARGCIVEKIREIEDIVIPNYFTPNGDGFNDIWYPRNLELYPNITVSIFDRYQRLLLTLKGNAEGTGWDGTYNGKLLPTGDYWYVVELNEAYDKRVLKGNFTLYRKNN